MPGDRGFESTSLHRRIACEPDFLDQARRLCDWRDALLRQGGMTRRALWMAGHVGRAFSRRAHDGRKDDEAASPLLGGGDRTRRQESMLLLPGAITAWPFAARAAKGESS